jgi:hypothetical protein
VPGFYDLLGAGEVPGRSSERPGTTHFKRAVRRYYYSTYGLTTPVIIVTIYGVFEWGQLTMSTKPIQRFLGLLKLSTSNLVLVQGG